jgi:SAM-dependent methyltransferase
MTTSLDKVRELNYDHHRRMTELHEATVKAGTSHERSETDDLSYRALLAHVPKTRRHILELGSASGGQWDLLKVWCAPDQLCELWGIDLYEPFVMEAQRQGKAIALGFVEDMSMFFEGQFDLVCSRHVMEHLGDVDQGIDEILRVTASGGYIAHVTPDMPIDEEPAHLNKWNRARWAAKWTQHDIKIISATRHPFNGGEVHIVGQKP